LVDISLGLGPSFKLAETLKDQGIPFVFVTGYDQTVIPEEFNDIERLEKPIQLWRIVQGDLKPCCQGRVARGRSRGPNLVPKLEKPYSIP
jgi:hypothetical protein